MPKRVFLPGPAIRNAATKSRLRENAFTSFRNSAIADRSSIMNVGKVWRLPETQRHVNDKTIHVNNLGRLRMQVQNTAKARDHWRSQNTYSVNSSRSKPGRASPSFDSAFPSDKRAHRTTRSNRLGSVQRSVMAQPVTSRISTTFPPI